MLWISLILASINIFAAELPRFYTKHSSETLRFISMDGRYAYVQKRPGVLGLVSNFRSVDFLLDNSGNNFLVRGSRFKNRLAIESIPNAHDELSMINNHKIFVIDYGNSAAREIGIGRNPRLHMNDEWISFYDIRTKAIKVVNLLTQKKYEIKLSKKANPFFIPEVEMTSGTKLFYTDINESGASALVMFDLGTASTAIVYKSAQNATRLELCQNEDYLAVGEFPYDGVSRNSKISFAKTAQLNSSVGLTSLYTSVEQDIGNMICMPDSIYFVKTMNHDKTLNHKLTDVVKLEISSQKVEAKSNLKQVSQIIEMDGRVLIPFRGIFYVLEGRANIGDDTLKTPTKEELQIDI